MPLGVAESIGIKGLRLMALPAIAAQIAKLLMFLAFAITKLTPSIFKNASHENTYGINRR
jgi:hypothetical protein